MGSKCQYATFSEHGHTAYQMKGNHECSNRETHILPADNHSPPPLLVGWGQKVKIQLMHGHVVHQIKGNYKCSNMVAIFFFAPPPPLDPGSQNSKFSEHGHVAYQINGNHECSNMVANILPTDPYPPYPHPDSWGGVKRSNSTFSEHGHVAYQIKWNYEFTNMVANILTANAPSTLGVKGHNSLFFGTWLCCLSN